jgi:hypothetical protein
MVVIIYKLLSLILTFNIAQDDSYDKLYSRHMSKRIENLRNTWGKVYGELSFGVDNLRNEAGFL